MEYVTLNNGIKMPKLGYGVYQTAPEDTKRCVLDAIETGTVDCFCRYGNFVKGGRSIPYFHPISHPYLQKQSTVPVHSDLTYYHLGFFKN